MGDAVGNYLNREALRIADRLVPSLAVAHHARKLESFGDPAAIFLAIQIDRQLHFFIIPRYFQSSHFFRNAYVPTPWIMCGPLKYSIPARSPIPRKV